MLGCNGAFKNGRSFHDSISQAINSFEQLQRDFMQKILQVNFPDFQPIQGLFNILGKIA